MLKNMCLLFFLLVVTTAVYADSHLLPQSWLIPNDDQKSFTEEEVGMPSQSASNHYLKVLNFNHDLVESSLAKNSENKHRRWYLHSIETKLALESAGTLGAIGLKGESVAKLHWNRTAASLAALQNQQTPKNGQKTLEDESDEIVQLNGDESPQDLEDKIHDLANALEKGGQINNQQQFLKNVLPIVRNYASAAMAMNYANDRGHWIPFRFQVDIYVEVTGSISPLVTLGGGTRIRLEWNRYKKIQPVNKSFLKPLELANSQIVDAIAYDFEKLSEFNSTAAAFTLDNIKVGIGVGAKGNIFLAKGKAGVRAALIYKRAPVAKNNAALILSENNKDNTPLFIGNFNSEKNNDEWNYSKIDRNALRSQMKKVLAMANFFTRKSEDNNRAKTGKHFELATIELELQMSMQGSIALVTVEGMSIIELVLNKHH